MGLTPDIAKFVYGTVGALALGLALIRVQSGFYGGAAFSFAIAVFAGFRFYQLMQEEE
ncbi:MAG: hypothetical protein AAF769_12985 [Pseudomonadota bacterium]